MSRKRTSGPAQDADSFERDLEQIGMKNLVRLAEELPDMDIRCVSTGFPQLDFIMHPVLKGFPLGRDIEIYSRDPECGKTSLALEFVKAAQQAGLRTVYADVEKTLTKDFLESNGICIREDGTGRIPLRMVRHTEEVVPAEEFLDAIRAVGQVTDVIVVDSVAALEKRANLEKSSEDRSQIGSMALLLSEFCKRNVSRRAAIIWINQMRTAIGGYSPTGATPLKTTGGKALGFFATLRLELSVLERIKDGKNDDPIGMKVRVFAQKNKIAPPWRQCVLTYLFGYGFSPWWDYMEAAMKLGAVEKRASWLQLERWKAQGPVNFHRLILEDVELQDALRGIVDGESIVEETVSEAESGQEEE